jgi:hypothetical protein
MKNLVLEIEEHLKRRAIVQRGKPNNTKRKVIGQIGE